MVGHSEGETTRTRIRPEQVQGDDQGSFLPYVPPKAKEGEFVQLQQGNMSVLEYASKFMELSRFAPAFVADERLKMNRFEAGLNPTTKERMSVRQYASYVDLYDTAVDVERAVKERSNYFNEQRGAKRKGDNRGNFQSQKQNRRPAGGQYSGNFNRGGQYPNTRPKVTYNACGKPGHFARECRTAKRCFRCGSHQHHV